MKKKRTECQTHKTQGKTSGNHVLTNKDKHSFPTKKYPAPDYEKQPHIKCKKLRNAFTDLLAKNSEKSLFIQKKGVPLHRI